MNRRNFFTGLFGGAAVMVATKIAISETQDETLLLRLRQLGNAHRKRLFAVIQRRPKRRLLNIEERSNARSVDTVLYATRSDGQYVYAVRKYDQPLEEARANLETFLHPDCACGIWKLSDGCWHSTICQHHQDLGIQVGLGRHIVYDITLRDIEEHKKAKERDEERANKMSEAVKELCELMQKATGKLGGVNGPA